VRPIEGQFAVAILAGGIVHTPAGDLDKAFIRVEGETLAERLVRVWREAGRAERLFVVGPPEARELPGLQGVDFVPRGADIAANLRLAVDWMQGAPHAALCGVDVPRVTAATIARFCAMIPDDCDVGYPVARREALEAMYPDVRWTYVKLRDGELTGGTIAYVRPEALQRIFDTLLGFFDVRKSTLALARLLGMRVMARYVLGRLTVADIVARAQQITGVRLAVLMDAPPELCIDIDRPSQVPPQ